MRCSRLGRARCCDVVFFGDAERAASQRARGAPVDLPETADELPGRCASLSLYDSAADARLPLRRAC